MMPEIFDRCREMMVQKWLSSEICQDFCRLHPGFFWNLAVYRTELDVRYIPNKGFIWRIFEKTSFFLKIYGVPKEANGSSFCFFYYFRFIKLFPKTAFVHI